MRHGSSQNPSLDGIPQCRPNRRGLWAGTLVVAIVVGTLSAHLAFSQADAAGRFRQFDKNGDGKITREESGNARWFDTLDRNHDGMVTLEETRAAAAIGAAQGAVLAASRRAPHLCAAVR